MRPDLTPRDLLARLFFAAVDAADPERCIARHLPERPRGRTVVVGAGKGCAQLARALERRWNGPLAGAVVTRYGFGVACESIEVLEAAHPIPDKAGLAASTRLLDLVQGLTADDLVIALICGGGSALLPAPPPGFSLADDIALNTALLKSGAPIAAMNAIRKQMSCIKGGRLAAAAHPARVATLVVSDIPGDDPALVSSGPTLPSATGLEDALRLIRVYRIGVEDSLLARFATLEPAPQPGDAAFSRDTTAVIASAKTSLEAAASLAQARGLAAHILSDSLEGEARDAGLFHAALVREVALQNRPFSRPCVLLSGGETTVTVRGSGKGGRNSEFMLSFARGISDLPNVHGLAADTDGLDGPGDTAGAFADGTTLKRLLEKGIRANDYLADNDSASAFGAIGDLFRTGPTGTNVNDFRTILIT